MGWLFAKCYDFMMRKAEAAGLGEWRSDLLSRAEGDVVELGAGTGVNLPLYPEAVTSVHATEPDRHMRERLIARAQENGDDRVDVVDAGAESLPFEDGSIDTVVTTLVLCTVPDPGAGVREAFRVLRPGGALLFLEHVAHEDPRLLRWQRRLDPFWKWFAAGCQLTRPTGQLMQEAGFQIEESVAERMPKAPPIIPTIRGVARKPQSEPHRRLQAVGDPHDSG